MASLPRSGLSESGHDPGLGARGRYPGRFAKARGACLRETQHPRAHRAWRSGGRKGSLSAVRRPTRRLAHRDVCTDPAKSDPTMAVACRLRDMSSIASLGAGEPRRLLDDTDHYTRRGTTGEKWTVPVPSPSQLSHRRDRDTDAAARAWDVERSVGVRGAQSRATCLSNSRRGRRPSRDRIANVRPEQLLRLPIGFNSRRQIIPADVRPQH